MPNKQRYGRMKAKSTPKKVPPKTTENVSDLRSQDSGIAISAEPPAVTDVTSSSAVEVNWADHDERTEASEIGNVSKLEEPLAEVVESGENGSGIEDGAITSTKDNPPNQGGTTTAGLTMSSVVNSTAQESSEDKLNREASAAQIEEKAAAQAGTSVQDSNESSPEEDPATSPDKQKKKRKRKKQKRRGNKNKNNVKETGLLPESCQMSEEELDKLSKAYRLIEGGLIQKLLGCKTREEVKNVAEDWILLRQERPILAKTQIAAYMLVISGKPEVAVVDSMKSAKIATERKTLQIFQTVVDREKGSVSKKAEKINRVTGLDESSAHQGFAETLLATFEDIDTVLPPLIKLSTLEEHPLLLFWRVLMEDFEEKTFLTVNGGDDGPQAKVEAANLVMQVVVYIHLHVIKSSDPELRGGGLRLVVAICMNLAKLIRDSTRFFEKAAESLPSKKQGRANDGQMTLTGMHKWSALGLLEKYPVKSQLHAVESYGLSYIVDRIIADRTRDGNSQLQMMALGCLESCLIQWPALPITQECVKSLMECFTMSSVKGGKASMARKTVLDAAMRIFNILQSTGQFDQNVKPSDLLDYFTLAANVKNKEALKKLMPIAMVQFRDLSKAETDRLAKALAPLLLEKRDPTLAPQIAKLIAMARDHPDIKAMAFPEEMFKIFRLTAGKDDHYSHENALAMLGAFLESGDERVGHYERFYSKLKSEMNGIERSHANGEGYALLFEASLFFGSGGRHVTEGLVEADLVSALAGQSMNIEDVSSSPNFHSFIALDQPTNSAGQQPHSAEKCQTNLVVTVDQEKNKKGAELRRNVVVFLARRVIDDLRDWEKQIGGTLDPMLRVLTYPGMLNPRDWYFEGGAVPQQFKNSLRDLLDFVVDKLLRRKFRPLLGSILGALIDPLNPRHPVSFPPEIHDLLFDSLRVSVDRAETKLLQWKKEVDEFMSEPKTPEETKVLHGELTRISKGMQGLLIFLASVTTGPCPRPATVVETIDRIGRFPLLDLLVETNRAFSQYFATDVFRAIFAEMVCDLVRSAENLISAIHSQVMAMMISLLEQPGSSTAEENDPPALILRKTYLRDRAMELRKYSANYLRQAIRGICRLDHPDGEGAGEADQRVGCRLLRGTQDVFMVTMWNLVKLLPLMGLSPHPPTKLDEAESNTTRTLVRFAFSRWLQMKIPAECEQFHAQFLRAWMTMTTRTLRDDHDLIFFYGRIDAIERREEMATVFREECAELLKRRNDDSLELHAIAVARTLFMEYSYIYRMIDIGDAQDDSERRWISLVHGQADLERLLFEPEGLINVLLTGGKLFRELARNSLHLVLQALLVGLHHSMFHDSVNELHAKNYMEGFLPRMAKVAEQHLMGPVEACAVLLRFDKLFPALSRNNVETDNNALLTDEVFGPLCNYRKIVAKKCEGLDSSLRNETVTNAVIQALLPRHIVGEDFEKYLDPPEDGRMPIDRLSRNKTSRGAAAMEKGMLLNFKGMLKDVKACAKLGSRTLRRYYNPQPLEVEYLDSCLLESELPGGVPYFMGHFPAETTAEDE